MALVPLVHLCGCFFVGAIEVKSILEPASEKEKKEMRQVAHLASEIAQHRTDPEEIAKAVVRYLGNDNCHKVKNTKNENE